MGAMLSSFSAGLNFGAVAYGNDDELVGVDVSLATRSTSAAVTAMYFAGRFA